MGCYDDSKLSNVNNKAVVKGEKWSCEMAMNQGIDSRAPGKGSCNLEIVLFRHTMMTSSNGNIFHVTAPLCGEFTGPGEFPTQRPVTRSFDVYFDLRLNKRLSKQPWDWWFETLSWSLWRHRNASMIYIVAISWNFPRVNATIPHWW